MGFSIFNKASVILCISVLFCITEVFGITAEQAAHLKVRLAEVKTKIDRVKMTVGNKRELFISLAQKPLPTVAAPAEIHLPTTTPVTGHKAASCSEMKSLNPAADNGEYTLYPFSTDKAVSIRVYCHGMASGNPKEFLPLPSGPDENYAIISSDRLANANGWGECTGPLQDPYDRAGTTKFSKLRIRFNESRVEVIRDDYTFAQTTGPNEILYGRAGDCYSGVQECNTGTFKVNLLGTDLVLAPGVYWVREGWPTHLTINDMFISEDRKVASGRCGGWCGNCFPAGNKLYLGHPQVSGSCPLPPTISGASISGCDLPYEENEVCSYSCNMNSGHFPEGGDQNRTCSGGSWEGSDLVCTKHDCYWEGTAFFCDPGDCDRGSFVRGDRCGDGMCCWTGWKIYCCTGV